MLGQLRVSLGLDAADFVQGLQRSEALAKRFSSNLETTAASAANSIRSLGAVAAGLGGVFAGTQLTAYSRQIIDGVDRLNDFADATGATIERISGLEDVALRTGTSIDTVAMAMIKLNGSLKEAKPDSSIDKALKAIGLSADDLRLADPAENVATIAKALSGFADDGNKARFIMEVFGKSTKEVAPFLKDLAEQGRIVATVTTEQAKAAEQFNKQLAELSKNSLDTARNALLPMVTRINEVTDAFIRGSKAGAGFFDTLKGQLPSPGGIGAAFGGDAEGVRRARITDGEEELRLISGRIKALEGLAGRETLLNDLLAKRKKIQYDIVTAKIDPSDYGNEGRRAAALPSVADVSGLGDDKKTGHKQIDRVAQAFADLNREIAVFGQQDDVLAKTLAFQDLNPTVTQLEKYKATLGDLQQLKAAADVDRFVKALQDENDALVLSKQQLTARTLALKGATGVQVEQALGILNATDAIRTQNDLMAEGKRLTEQMRNPLEALNDEYEKLNKLLAGDAINGTTYRRGVEAAQEAYAKAMEPDKLRDKIKETDDAARELGMTFSSAFEDAIVGGKDFRQILKGLEDDLLRIGTRKLITEKLAASATEFFGGDPWGSVGKLVGKTSSLFGGSSAGAAAGGSDFAANFLSTFGGFFADGGGLPAGKWGIAGERGPELIRGPAHVVPTNRSMAMLDRMASQSRGGDRGNVFNTTFVLPPGGYSRATQQQIEAGMARSVAAANARLN